MSLVTLSLVVAAALGSAVVGGIFFAFSNFVMKALANTPSKTGIEAMQSINTVVLNRWFLGVFTGTAAACVLLAGIAITNWNTPFAPYLLASAVGYVGGTWVVTVLGNVPLNQRLAEVQPGDPAASEQWERYVERWTKLNSQRALAAILSAFLLTLALVL